MSVRSSVQQPVIMADAVAAGVHTPRHALSKHVKGTSHFLPLAQAYALTRRVAGCAWHMACMCMGPGPSQRPLHHTSLLLPPPLSPTPQRQSYRCAPHAGAECTARSHPTMHTPAARRALGLARGLRGDLVGVLHQVHLLPHEHVRQDVAVERPHTCTGSGTGASRGGSARGETSVWTGKEQGAERAWCHAVKNA